MEHPSVAKFVSTRFDGNIPVVLCAPHGGAPSEEQARVFQEREDADNVIKKGDLRTQELLYAIDQCIMEQTGGKRAYTVRLNVHRRYIDCNRDGNDEADRAFNKECMLARQVWRHYHQCIEQCLQNAMEHSPTGRVLLLDIHGMRPFSDYIVVGSRNKETACFEGDHSVEAPFQGFLYLLRQTMGRAVLPKQGEPDVAKYSGGYTVNRHGDGGKGGRVDGLQLEFGAFLRLVDLRNEVAKAAASAVVHYLHPMSNFIRHVSFLRRWAEADLRVVEDKLRQIRCYTPLDLRKKIEIKGIGEINKRLRFLRAKCFRKSTLDLFSRLLSKGPGHWRQLEEEQDEVEGGGSGSKEEREDIGRKGARLHFQVVRRIFLPGSGAAKQAGTVLALLQEQKQGQGHSDTSGCTTSSEGEDRPSVFNGWCGPAAQKAWEKNTLGGGSGPNSTITCALRNFTHSSSSSEDDEGKLFRSNAGNDHVVEGQALTIADASDFHFVYSEWKARMKAVGGNIVVVPIQIARSGTCTEEGLAYASIHDQ